MKNSLGRNIKPIHALVDTELDNLTRIALDTKPRKIAMEAELLALRRN